ncbi:MAG: AIR synthase-related protein [Lachnospiraceae bacterium]
MKAGKAAEAVLKRSVIKAVNKQEYKEKVSRAGVGRDAGLFGVPAGAEHLAMSCALHCGTERQAASLAVYRACNSLAASGGLPEFVTAQFTLPEGMEEAEVRTFMEELSEACQKTGTALTQGHTEFTRRVTAPVVSVTALGAVAGCPAQENTLNQTKKQGMELVMTKYAGLSGTALLAGQYRERLHTRYMYSLIDKAERLYDMVSVQPEAALLQQLGVTAMHDVAEGGVFGAVWELAERENIGLTLDLKKIPIRQETVEVCEFFDLNPYQVKGDGALLFLTEESARVIAALEEAGIPAAVIGIVEDNNDRVVKNEDEVRFLEPNRVDDYEKAEG